MKNNYSPMISRITIITWLFCLAVFVMPKAVFGQQDISDFVILSGSAANPSGQVYLGPSSQVVSGDVAAHGDINGGNNIIVQDRIIVSGRIDFGNGAELNSDIYAGAVSGNAIAIGNWINLNGNIASLGNISLSKKGTISGSVTHPASTSFSGPSPAGGEILATPTIPSLPAMPAVTTFSAAGTMNINGSIVLTPGSYGDIYLGGSNTVTFLGAGDYTFNSVSTTGAGNTIIYDFQNNPGNINIHIHGDADWGHINSQIINGGDPTRIYAETHGTGVSSGGYAWQMSNGSGGATSEWNGTVFAPYGGITVGGSNSGGVVKGALFSATSIYLSNGTQIYHHPFVGNCQDAPLAFAGADTLIDCITPFITLHGSSDQSNVNYAWTAFNGGSILSGASSASVVIESAGTFVLTVTESAGICSSMDTVIVTFDPCIDPYYKPPEGGKTSKLIGAELTSLNEYFGNGTDSLDNIFVLEDDSVYIEVITIQGQYNTILNLLQTPEYGITKLIDNGPNSLIITGLYPVANLKKLDSLPQYINYVRPVYPALVNSGLVTSQGDISIKSDLARMGFDIDGSGVKVGVISDSYNTIPGDPANTNVINGDLPGLGNPDYPTPVGVLKDFPFGRRSDEGRAMLQIVHDVAPGAELAFRTGFISSGDFAKGIYELAGDSCDVIVDDITYVTEPFFQDGAVAKAVNAVSAQGVTYVSAAGNYGSKAYGATFSPATAPEGVSGSAHDFGGGDILQNVSLEPGDYTIVLQWQDSVYSIGQTSTGTVNDLDIYLSYDNGSTLFGFNRENLGGDPIEVLPFTVTEPTQSNILVVRAAGTQNVEFKFIVFRGDLTFNEHVNGASTLVGQANAEGAIAVGAVLYEFTPPFGENNPTVASFSSRGGTPVNGVVREKPDISGPNGVNTTVDLGGFDYDGDPFPNFFGTSAAAPHVAGVAALLQQARQKFYNEALAPAAVEAIMQGTATPMYGPGFDFESGYGLVDADSALRGMASPTPEILSLLIPDGVVPGDSAFTLIVEGNYLTDFTNILFRGDTLATTYVNENELEATIPGFIGNPTIVLVTSSTSPSGLDGGTSDTLYFFTPVKEDVVVTANSESKHYGEAMPSFSISVTVDGTPLDSTNYSLSDLGLDNVQYHTPANTLSNTGLYFIRPYVDSMPVGYTELFNFEFIDGLLEIDKLPLRITPRDTSLTYGDALKNISYTYAYDDSLIDASERQLFESLLNQEYTQAMSNTLALVDGRSTTTATGRVLVNADLLYLSSLASARALVNARSSVSSRVLVNGTVEYDTMQIVDVSPLSVFNYQSDSAEAPLVSAKSSTSARALVNAGALVNGLARVSGRVLVNGSPIVNSSTVSNDDSTEVVVIIDEDDVNAPADDTLTGFTPLNMITGLGAGTHAIVPAAFISENFDITYGLGELQIAAAELTVEVDDTSFVYGDTVGFSSEVSGFKYDDTDTSVYQVPVTYTVKDLSQQQISGAPNAGSFTVHADSLNLIAPVDYFVTYINGALNISKADLLVDVNDASAEYGEAPVYSAVLSGFEYDDSDADVYSGPLTFTLTQGGQVVNGNPDVGNYTIQADPLNLLLPENYNISYQSGGLSVSHAPLMLSVQDGSETYGASPAFNALVTGYKNGDIAADVFTGPITYSVTDASSQTVIGNLDAGSYTVNADALQLIQPSNYIVSYDAGDWVINPAQLTVEVNDVSAVYGDNLTYSATVSGFQYSDTDSDVYQGPLSFSVLDGSNTIVLGIPVVGTYTVSANSLQLLPPVNYTVDYVSGSLQLIPAVLTVTANTDYISEGDALPAFSSTITGWVNGGLNTIVSGPQYSLSPYYSGAAGVYDLTPSSLILDDPANYSIAYVNGEFYVNPAGSGTRKIVGKLDCVDTLVPAQGQYTYIAYFSYENENAVPVYIPEGPDNYISASGPYSGSLPIVFQAGGGSFEVLFTGASMTWVVSSHQGAHKSSTASDASSGSNKCKGNGNGNGKGNKKNDLVGSESYNLMVYPNPASDYVHLSFDEELELRRDEITVYDMLGHEVHVMIREEGAGNSFRIGLDGLRSGVYLLKFENDKINGYERIIKN